MNNLREDLEELPPGLHRWCRRKRREAGIGREEAACWFVYHEAGDEPPNSIDLGRSPGDMLTTAEMYANSRMMPARGTGRWLAELHGDGENPPEYVVVRPRFDEQQP